MNGNSNENSTKRRGLDDLLEYFEKGKSFSEELMKENERLRVRLIQLEKEKMEVLSESNSSNLEQIICQRHVEQKYLLRQK